MKTFKIAQEKVLYIFSKSKIVLLFLIISLTTLLSSCTIGYHSPYSSRGYAGYNGYYDGYGGYVYPEYYGGVIVNPWNYRWRHEHHEWIYSHPNWRHDYRNYREGFHSGYYRGNYGRSHGGGRG